MQSSLQANLNNTPFFDHKHPSVRDYGKFLAGKLSAPTEIAIALYNGVRDDIRYNPYTFRPAAETFSASYCLAAKESYCIPKAVLLAALARSFGIPARIGLADVKNHLASPQFLAYLKNDIFVMHGYTELYLEGKWVKATPAFDSNLCAQMHVAPLEFNGRDDSIFHEFDTDGARHMEYLADHGVHSEVPHAQIIQAIAHAYPHLAEGMFRTQSSRSYQADLQEQGPTNN